MEIDQSFIAAILTVIGYQINDTVVVFDRVRENVGLLSQTGLLHHHQQVAQLDSRTYNHDIGINRARAPLYLHPRWRSYPQLYIRNALRCNHRYTVDHLYRSAWAYLTDKRLAKK